MIKLGGADEIQSRTCFLPMVTAREQEFLFWHAQFSRQILPYAGGLLNQPNHYMEAMDLMSTYDARARVRE